MDEQNELPQLPKDWAWTAINEVAQLLRGVSYDKQEASKEPRKNLIPILRANNIDGELNFDDLVYVPPERVKQEQFVKAFDILIAMSSGSKDLVGKAAQAKQDFNGGFGTFCGLVRPLSEVDKRFVGFFFQSPNYRHAVSTQSSGVNINNLRREHIESMPIPLAPLPEQHRIVAKIEELFSDLDAGVESLRKIQAQLKRYRQAVLKAAVEGKLTTAWRVANAGKIEPASALLEKIRAERAKNANDKAKPLPSVDASELPELPQGWEWTRVGELFDVSYGLSESLSKTEPDNELDLPVIRIPNITEFGRLDLTKLKYFTLEKNKREKLLLKRGDVLFNWRNAPKWIGRSTLFDKEGAFVNASFLLKLRPIMLGYGAYVAIWFNHLRLAGYFMTRVTNAVNQANFNATMTAQMEVSLPPLAEQQQIIAEIERRLSVADEVEKTIDVSLKQAERLRQSILKRAFAGKLVPQDPSDEPAERLLERIREQRNSSDVQSAKQMTLPIVKKKIKHEAKKQIVTRQI